MAIPPCDSQGRSCWGVLILRNLLDDAQRDTLKSVYQALGVPMQRMSYHVVDFLRRALVRSSDGRDRSTPSRPPSGENPFHLMPWWQVLSKDPMRSASKRALTSSNFCLCSGVSSSYVTGSPFDIPMAKVDVVDVEGPTGRARMCCRPKPTNGCRQATRELGGPEPLSIGPAARTRPEVEVHWACHLTYTWSGRCLMCFN
jgi:hypothetical protein